jgi:2'-5' RNA ligase
MRLFIAIQPPDPTLAHLQRMQQTLRPLLPARWTPRDQLHLTLKFLGETPDDQLPDLIEALRQIEIKYPIHLRPTAVVCFPPQGSIRIIAAALEDQENRCANLADEIDLACHRAGYRLESRRWTPHITLARVKERTSPDIRRQISTIQLPGPGFEVAQFQLKQSRLSSSGPAYLTLATFE